jgi:hypothetical protein
MDKTVKLGLLGAITLLAAAPIGAQAAPANAQALAQSRGVQLIDARWYHHHWRRRYCAYYGCGYYYHRHYWRHRRWW